MDIVIVSVRKNSHIFYVILAILLPTLFAFLCCVKLLLPYGVCPTLSSYQSMTVAFGLYETQVQTGLEAMGWVILIKSLK